MIRIVAGVEYDGSSFSGWQLQSAAPSVQQALEAALSRIADQPVRVVAAGRTDTGVHARCLVIHFDTEVERRPRAWLLGANTHLPPGIALRWVREMPGHFHARYSALSRTYRYVILSRPTRPALADSRVTFTFRPLTLAPMQAAAVQLLGTHDFSAFRAAECQAISPVRRMEAIEVVQNGDFFVAEITANAFLHHMVRNIMGLLMAVGQGKLPPGRAGELLALRDRKLAPPTAAASGLYLWRVRYPSVFELPDDSAIMLAPAGCPADLMGRD
ncbi:MAG: tRNA pseudouridine(38-40) synthase TruA [Steroidobacteraceae bacterium]